MSDIAQWLKQLGLDKYAQTFAENDIDLQVVPNLTDDDLKELGLSLGHRRILQSAISELVKSNQASTTVPIEPVAAPTGEAERRQLTILFCDLVGSTELSQRLDPEELGTIIREFQNKCAQTIQVHEGYVARYMGDGLLAYFGYPVAHEDAVERAIRAGLSLVANMNEINASTGEDFPTRLTVRVGIATGPVVVGDLIGDGVAQENIVAGETPNLAARLQALAVPDTVVIATKTKQLAGNLFEYTDGGTQALKGIAAPVQIWTVKGEAAVKSRFDAMHASELTPMVGREQEIALLYDRWEQAQEGDGQVVLLSGEAGIGKSRVAQTLRGKIANDNSFRLRYQCSAYHINSALRPFITQLEWASHFDSDDQAETKLDKIESMLAQATNDTIAIMPLFASLLSIPYENRYPTLTLAPEQQKAKTLEALVEQMRLLAEQQPVLLIFEDAHWSDPTSLELLGSIIEEAQGNRVLVLITFRPDFSSPWTGYSHITALTLNRFNRARVVAMMAKVTSGKHLPKEVLDQIIEKTDGIPLFVEELTKTVIESNLLEDQGDHYTLAGPLTTLAIPSTLQDSLVARLDRIAAVKEIAQIAAVIGREFSYGLLAKISSLPDNELTAALQQLKDAALVFARGAPPHTRYFFKHAMVQDAAYEGLLKSRRRLIHAQVAKALENELTQADPELLAHHFSEAGMVEPAIEYWLKAGQRALERSANIEAATHLRRGLELLKDLPDSADNRRRELDMLLVLGPALMAKIGYAAPEIEQVYARARDLCQQIGDSFQLFPATWGLWVYYQYSGQLIKARDLSEEVLAAAKQQDDRGLMLQAHHAAWATFHRLGELENCLYHSEQGIKLYDVQEHRSHAYLYGGHDPGVCAESHIGIVLWCLGFPDRALDHALKGLKICEQLSHPFSQTDALFGVVRVHLLRREFHQAKIRAQEMIDLAKQNGFAIQLVLAKILLGSALINEAKSNKWINDMQQGIVTLTDAGTKAHVPYLYALLTDAYLQTGEASPGLLTAAEALKVVDNTGERYWQGEIYRLKGELLLINSAAEAEKCFEQAMTIVNTQNANTLRLRVAMSLARLWQSQNKPKDACDLLTPIYRNFTEGFDTLDLTEATRLMDDL